MPSQPRYYLLAAVPFLFNTGLQVSGISNVATTVVCWSLVAVILIWVSLNSVREWNVNQRNAGALGVQTWHFILAGIIGTWIFMTVALGAGAWSIFQHSSDGLQTSQTSVAQPQAMKADGPLVWFVNLGMEGGKAGSNVFSLRFYGKNASQKEVRIKGGSIISAIDGKRVPLEILAQSDIIPLDQIELVPAGAPIELVAKFGPPDPASPGKILGLDTKTFLESWRQFSFNVEDDTTKYRLTFNEGDVAPLLPGMTGPRVTKKAEANAK